MLIRCPQVLSRRLREKNTKILTFPEQEIDDLINTILQCIASNNTFHKLAAVRALQKLSDGLSRNGVIDCFQNSLDDLAIDSSLRKSFTRKVNLIVDLAMYDRKVQGNEVDEKLNLIETNIRTAYNESQNKRHFIKYLQAIIDDLD